MQCRDEWALRHIEVRNHLWWVKWVACIFFWHAVNGQMLYYNGRLPAVLVFYLMMVIVSQKLLLRRFWWYCCCWCFNSSLTSGWFWAVGGENEDRMVVDPQFNAGAQVPGLKDDVAGDALEHHHQIDGVRESVPAENQRGEELAAMWLRAGIQKIIASRILPASLRSQVWSHVKVACHK